MTSCVSPRAFISKPWLQAPLFVLLALALSGSDARAEADGSSSTASVFVGYLGEQVGPIRWVFPQEADDLVDELQQIQQDAWKTLTEELGAEIAPQLEIRIAIDPEKMQKLAPQGAKLPEYATGVAFPAPGIILLTLTAPESWKPAPVKAVLVHELSHLALHRAVRGLPLPRWFQEGVAIRQAEEISLGRLRVLWEAVVQDRLIPLQNLSQAFPARHIPANLAYAQSADFLGFLLDGTDNQRRFKKLIKALREGEAFPEAVLGSYNVSLGYLEREWRRGLQERFRRLPLLLTGVGTVWVLTAVLLMFGYFRIRRRQRATLRRWAEQENAERIADSVATAGTAELEESPRLHSKRQGQSPEKGGVPTIEYEGRNHTLH